MPCKPAIPTMSLGHYSAGHFLESKLDTAKAHGYEGIELCYEDLVAVAGRRACDPGANEPLPPSDQTDAARKIRVMCQQRGLTIINLQPFMQYEGLLDRREHDCRFEELLNWIKLARILGTDMIMMPASSLPDEAIGDIELIVKDLQKAADAGRRENPHIRFAYESRCSATRIDRWEFCWDVVEKVRRDNFGMCLDTFHLASLPFADPSVPSGRKPDGEKAVEMSMQRLLKRVKSHCDKIFLVQMGDARLPNDPIVPGSSEYSDQERPRAIWSQKYRLFYGEVARGAYLPIREIADTIFNGIGYEGWVSLELFNTRMACEDKNVPLDLARRGIVSWRKLENDMGWWPLEITQK